MILQRQNMIYTRGFNWFAGQKVVGGGMAPILANSLFVSDTPRPVAVPDLFVAPLNFTADMPRQLYIVRVRVTMDSDEHPDVIQPGEIDIFVDQGGRWYQTGSPHGAENGIAVGNQALVYDYVYGAPYNRTWDLRYPALVDRDATPPDLLFVYFLTRQNYSWLNVEFDYLIV
jgi:hypothetical protein